MSRNFLNYTMNIICTLFEVQCEADMQYYIQYPLLLFSDMTDEKSIDKANRVSIQSWMIINSNLL